MLTRHATKEYHAPADSAALFAMLAEGGSRTALLAGGISLHWRGNSAARLIDLRHIISHEITVTADAITIGAGATLAEVATAKLSGPLAALAQACAAVASPQIRNVATLGGNLISHFDFSDTLGSLYLLEPDLRVITRSGVTVKAFADFVVKEQFALPAETVLDALVFSRAKLAGWRGGQYLKESRLGRDIATVGLTVLDRADGGFDVALSSYWLQPRCFRGITAVDDMRAQLEKLPPPKSDQRAGSEQRQRLIVPLLERALAGGGK